MENIDIIKLFRNRGLLVKPGVLDDLKKRKDEEIVEIVEKIGQNSKEGTVVSETTVKEVTHEVKVPDFVEVKRPSDFKPLAKEYGHDYKLLKDWDVTGKSKTKGELEDFVRYFNDRFKRLREILLSRPSKNRIVSIGSLDNVPKNTEARFIGMVSAKRTTKKGHITIDIEDDTGTATILVLNETKGGGCFEKSSRVIMDEVIAIDVKVTNNFNIASDIIWPDISVKNKKTIEKDLSIAFLSDIHVGSKHFKDKEFERMLKWLNGGESGKSIAEKIGYLLIAGDIADGIGIYPRQEQDLLIKDIYEQYALFQKFLDIIPDHIQIFITPGNHDAVRHAEPQPALEKDLIPENDRIHSLSNPTHLEIEGLKTLMYHGTSMESLVTDIPGLSFARPEEVAVEYLKRRTLCPIYDKNEIAPENRDYLFVDEVDIFQTAHVHKNGYTEYRGTVVLNAGTWLDKTTKWQLRRGFTPTPGILPIYNMKEGRITHIDFNSSELRIF